MFEFYTYLHEYICVYRLQQVETICSFCISYSYVSIIKLAIKLVDFDPRINCEISDLISRRIILESMEF